jgi:PAS domain S-box-containing protein
MRILRSLRGPGAAGLLERLRQRRAPRRERLQQSERVFGLFVASVEDYGIFMLEPDGRIATWNRGAQRIKGYTEEEALGRHFSMFYGQEDRERNHPDHELVIAARDGRYEEEGWRIRKDGNRFWAGVTITAVRDESGRLVGYGKVTRDLTERRQNEEALRKASAQAEASSQAKSEFLAAMSHELRTPLNAIVGYTDLLEGGIAGPLSRAQIDHLGRIRTASGHLLLQIDQILSLARIEAGREELHLEKVDAAELARDVLSMVAPTAKGKGLAITLGAPDRPISLRTDTDKVRQILLHLLSNASKYTDQGEIGLRVESNGAGAVQFHVWDTGLGIAPEDHERIFERFTQVDQSSTRTREGTGLGLAIARELTHLLHGELRLHSDLGAGSRFTLHLPANGGDPARPPN